MEMINVKYNVYYICKGNINYVAVGTQGGLRNRRFLINSLRKRLIKYIPNEGENFILVKIDGSQLFGNVFDKIFIIIIVARSHLNAILCSRLNNVNQPCQQLCK